MSGSFLNIEKVVADSLRNAGVTGVLAGVSGGADSVALLRAMLAVGAERVTIHAVHCNFHLRGSESMRDERFVRSLCDTLHIPLDVIDFDVDEYRRVHGGSVEMACRDLRYDLFRRMMTDLNLDRIAVAHTLDDNVETFFLNLMRGAGSRGLGGMVADNGSVIRPLLGVTRGEIEDYLAVLKQPFITDSSNLTDDYSRNFIRNRIIPLLAGRWENVRRSVAKSQGILAEENELLSFMVKSSVRDNGRFLPRATPGMSVAPMTFFFRFISYFGGSAAIAAEMAETMHIGFDSRRWRLSDYYCVAEERDGWRIIDVVEDCAGESEIGVPGDMEWSKFEMNDDLWHEIRQDRSNSRFWTSLEPAEYYFRHPEKGDRMTVIGMKGTSLLSDIMKDAHLSLTQRQNVILSLRRDTGEIVWASGLKRSALDLVSLRDKTIWCLHRKDDKF